MKAALLTKINGPLVLCEIEPAEPLKYGQVLVKVLVSGICGRQLKEIDGTMPGGPLPHPLGHEGCGLVQQIGPGVKHVKVGDKVVMHWRPGAGIEADYPKYFSTRLVSSKFFTGGRVTTFMNYSVCSENRLTTVPAATSPNLCALLGCSLSTALGTTEREAHLLRGESILIVGCGGLGVSLILAARLMGAHPIYVIDNVDKARLAYSLEASVFIPANSASQIERRFDVIVETSGSVNAIESTLPLLAESGRYIMVGQPREGAAVTIVNAFHLFEGEGKSIKATQGGCFKPQKDCRRYVNFFNNFAQGTGRLKKLVSHEFGLNEINEAISLVKTGHAGRVMIVMDH